MRRVQGLGFFRTLTAIFGHMHYGLFLIRPFLSGTPYFPGAMPTKRPSGPSRPRYPLRIATFAHPCPEAHARRGGSQPFCHLSLACPGHWEGLQLFYHRNPVVHAILVEPRPSYRQFLGDLLRRDERGPCGRPSLGGLASHQG